MNRKHILVVTNPDTMKQDLFGWISNTVAFDMAFADDHECAIEVAHQQLFDMVLIDATDEAINHKKLKAILPILNAEVLLVLYNGETAEELTGKVKQAFDIKKMQRLKRLLILDATKGYENTSLPPFSVN